MIPVSYWLTASDEGLQNVALGRRNQAANVRKEIKQMLDELKGMQAEAENLEVEAGVASWLLAHRKEILEKSGQHLEALEDVRERENAA